MRHLALATLATWLCVAGCAAQENPITNGSFEQLDAQGLPVDWQYLGKCSIVPEAHTGANAVLLERDGDQGETGLNRAWAPDSGEQGAMLAAVKGGVRFWYQILEASGPEPLVFWVIPMSADPMENTGEARAAFRAPAAHGGDGQWHEGVLKYDFAGKDRVRWVQISPRVGGQQARVLLDDITWIKQVGALPAILKTTLEEVPGREGEECLVTATVQNVGDQPLEAGTATVEVPAGLRALDGADRIVDGLPPDALQQLSWRVAGRRDESGDLGLRFAAGSQTATATLTYAPELEIVGLFADPFIISPERPAQLALRVRNSGHAMVREVQADLTAAAPLVVPDGNRTQTLTRIRPQTEAVMNWGVTAAGQTPLAEVSARIAAANAEGGRAQSTLVVGGPEPPSAPALPQAGVAVTETYAAIGNERVCLVLPRSEMGYGIGRLYANASGGWVLVGSLPRVTRLVAPADSLRRDEHLVYATTARTVDSPEAVGPQMLTRHLELVGAVTDAAGVNWAVTETIVLRPDADRFRISVSATPDRAAQLLALDGPMLYAGEGSPTGTRRLDAIFPGVEWLVEGEDSSSDLDIAADHPDRVRRVPHPHMVTMPLMSARLALPGGHEALVSLQWDHLQPYYDRLDRPSAIFASPDRWEGHASTQMGVFAPSLPEYILPNRTVAHKPLAVAGGQSVTLEATLLARELEPGETALEAVRTWFEDHGVPAPRPFPHGQTWTDEIEFSMAAYLDTLWDPELEKWHPSLGGPALWDIPGWPPANLYDLRMCLEACQDPEVKELVRERYERVVELSGTRPIADDMGYHYAGPAESLLAQAQHVAGLIRSQGEDGSWRFRARIETEGVFKGMDYSELGPDNAAEVGTCARNAWTILAFARMTGDPEATAAGLKALDFMDQFVVPRAAQVWEVPVHTPDILASADACEAYIEGYRITGERRHLDKAIYWAWTGLPFLYVWDKEGYEFLRYASIPVFGATWFEGSWFARPVQWNGLRFAYALMQLAPYDDSLDWARIARGTTISCMYQQSSEEKDKALWPDSVGAIDLVRSGWIFSPHQILANVYAEMGLQPTPLTIAIKTGEGELRVTAAGRLADASFADGTASCTVAYTPPQTGYVTVCNSSRPTQVRVNGAVATEVPLPYDAEPPCWRYLEHAALLEIRLAGSGEHRLDLDGVAFVGRGLKPPLATRIDFSFETDTEGWQSTHDVGPLVVEQGSLVLPIMGPDPYLVRGNCDVPATAVKQLRFRMAVDAGLGTLAQVFWTTAASPTYDEAKALHFPVVADGEFHEYTVPVGEHPLWQDTITGLRLDPTGGPVGANVRLDYVRGE